jgi:cobalt-zinc-cadmium efflux system protein
MIILMDATPSDIDLQGIEQDIGLLPGVINIHHVHAWMLTSKKIVMSLHVKITEMKLSSPITQDIHDLLKSKYAIYFSTIQCEVDDCLDNPEAEEIDFNKDI